MNILPETDQYLELNGSKLRIFHQPTSIEFTLETDSFMYQGAFAGVGHSLRELKQSYSGVPFGSLHQVHSDIVVEFTTPLSEEPLGDAGLSKLSNFALVTKTADCLPLLIMGPKSGILSSIHAGWKGVCSLIHLSALDRMKSLYAQKENWICILGPHIQQRSFEIEEPVLQLLSISVEKTGLNPKNYYVQKGKKYYFDLQKLVGDQLLLLGVNKENLISVGGDTLTNPKWNSFRRDKEKSARNLNFVYKINK